MRTSTPFVDHSIWPSGPMMTCAPAPAGLLALVHSCAAAVPAASANVAMNAVPATTTFLPLMVVPPYRMWLSATPSPSNLTGPVSYTHLRAHETPEHLVCR